MSLIPASYSVFRGRAYAGQIADTSLYNIDGACVVNENEKIMIGKLVAVKEVEPVDGHKIVTKIDGLKYPVLGVAVMSHAYSPTGVYEEATAINVMTHGRVWVLTDAALPDAEAGFGKYVTFNADGVISNKDIVLNSNCLFTGEILPTTDPKYKIAKIQLVQDVLFEAATGG